MNNSTFSDFCRDFRQAAVYYDNMAEEKNQTLEQVVEDIVNKAHVSGLLDYLDKIKPVREGRGRATVGGAMSDSRRELREIERTILNSQSGTST